MAYGTVQINKAVIKKMFRFESLEIWKLAVGYGEKLYKIADQFPRNENFAMSDQLRRAALSISNNIAEGSGGTTKEFCNHLNMSVKSTLETVNILLFANKEKYINNETRKTLYLEAETLIKRKRAFKKSLFRK